MMNPLNEKLKEVMAVSLDTDKSFTSDTSSTVSDVDNLRQKFSQNLSHDIPSDLIARIERQTDLDLKT